MSTSGGAAGRGLALIGWIALTFSAAVTGVWVAPDGWYAGLVKPAWNPPAWVFGPVWTLLYVLMAVAAWMVWRRGGWQGQRRALGLYLLQWGLNALWTPLFFGLHRPGLAFGESLLLVVAVWTTLVVFWRVTRVAGVLMVPYGIWVGFAAVLNGVVWRLNAAG